MSWTHDARFASALLVVAVGLTGCAASTPPSSSAAVPSTAQMPDGVPTVDERFTSDIPAELRVTAPKDAGGIGPCDLLTEDQLIDFGLDPRTARTDPTLYGSVCQVQYRDGSTSAGIGLSTDPRASKLPDLYRLRDNYGKFEILQVAGHPALRADRAPTGQCALNLAIADDQIAVLNVYTDGRLLPDPCAPARRMAELIISNLANRP